MQAHKPNIKGAANRDLFKTLKVVLDSSVPLSVKEIALETELGERMTQRHVEDLSNIGLINRVNKTTGIGYMYRKNIQFIDAYKLNEAKELANG